MATLDHLLAAVSQRPYQAVLLVPGRQPAVLCDGREAPAVRNVLDAAAVARLVGEVAPPGLDPADAPWVFEYAVGGRRYLLEGTLHGDEIRVRVVPVASAGAGPGLGTTSGAAAAPGADATATASTDTAAAGSADPSAAAAAAPGPVPPAPTPISIAAAAPGGPVDEGHPPVRPGAARRLSSLEPLLEELLERGGSDLHLTSGELPRLRVDGELVALRGWFAPDARELRALLETVTPEANRDEFAERNDTDYGFELPGRARFRANLFRDHCGVCAVFRQIPKDIPSAEQLGLPPAVASLSELPRGLVLVTGPTGSGKSTTLAAILDRVNATRADHIITIEDPIEFVHPSKRCLVHQREVGTHTASFARALRAALREDPDIVLVGEMRDLETTRVAIETAETGHLVFGTLHTTSAAGTVERLINQYPEGEQAQIRLMLSGSLKAVVAQTLLKRIGGGRVAAYEVLLVTPAIANLIREGKVFQIPSAMQTGRGRGMVLLDESLLALVRDGVVTADDALAKANDRTELTNRLRAAQLLPEAAGDERAEDDTRAPREPTLLRRAG